MAEPRSRKGLFRYVIEGTNKVVALVGGGGAAVLVVLTAMEVVKRYFLNNPTEWMLEISEYILVVVAFAGMAYGIQVAGHVGVDILYQHYPMLSKSIVNVIGAILTSIFWALFTWIAMQQSLAYLIKNARSETLLAVPLFYPMIPLVVGGLLCCLQSFVLIYDEASTLLRGEFSSSIAKVKTQHSNQRGTTL